MIKTMPAALLRTTGFAVALVFASAVFGVDETASVQKPDVKVDDSWTYRYTDYPTNLPRTSTSEMRVTFVEPNMILMVHTNRSGRESDSHWTPEWSAMASSGGRVYEPPQRLLQFPLQVGATYTYAYGIAATRGSSMRTKSEGTANVMGWEDIVVPAGKFRALRVEAKGTIQRLDIRSAGWQRWEFWYVPEVKRWVKLAYETGPVGRPSTPSTKEVHELVEFNVQ